MAKTADFWWPSVRTAHGHKCGLSRGHGQGKNQTDKAKLGWKPSVLTDKFGGSEFVDGGEGVLLEVLVLDDRRDALGAGVVIAAARPPPVSGSDRRSRRTRDDLVIREPVSGCPGRPPQRRGQHLDKSRTKARRASSSS